MCVVVSAFVVIIVKVLVVAGRVFSSDDSMVEDSRVRDIGFNGDDNNNINGTGASFRW